MLLNKANKLHELGYMIDCSRGAVPRVETIKQLVDVLSAFGYDYLMLYTEDTFEIEGEPYFGFMRGRYTKEEIHEIDMYCQSKNIELRPCIETLAHLGRLLRHGTYRKLFEIDDILFVDEPIVYDFIEKMIKTVSENFTSKHIHIGMDEAWKLGRGRYLDKHGKTKIRDIMESHLEKVAAIAKKYGMTCDMWADMLMDAYINDNEKVNIPDNVIPMPWRYWAKSETDSDAEIKLYKQLSNGKVAFAGGAHKWTGFAPGNQFSFHAIDEQVKTCIKYKYDSYLLTAWGDGASDASCFVTVPAIYYAALKCHGLTLNNRTKKYFKDVIGISFDKYLLVDRLNRIDDSIDYGAHYNALSFTHLYNDPLQDLFLEIEDDKYENLYLKASNELNKVKSDKYGYIFKTLSLLGKVDSYKSTLGKNIYNAYKENDKDKLVKCIEQTKKASIALTNFMKEYEKQWLKENKAFGYEKQILRLGGLKERLAFTIRQLQDYLAGKIEKIDELEVEHLPSDYYGRPLNADYEDFASYVNIVSGGSLKDI